MNVVGISGSLRTGSTNTKALKIALRFAAEAGATVREINLKEFVLPIYDQDINPPPIVDELRTIFKNADMIVIASPEYNYSIPGGLKNAIDCVSRKVNPFDGKVISLFGSSSGPFGTIRMQPHLRQVMTFLNAHVLPQPQVMIRNGESAFTQDGELVDKALEEQLKTLIFKSMKFAQAMKNL